jgi:hypothetical protein
LQVINRRSRQLARAGQVGLRFGDGLLGGAQVSLALSGGLQGDGLRAA